MPLAVSSFFEQLPQLVATGLHSIENTPRQMLIHYPFVLVTTSTILMRKKEKGIVEQPRGWWSGRKLVERSDGGKGRETDGRMGQTVVSIRSFDSVGATLCLCNEHPAGGPAPRRRKLGKPMPGPGGPAFNAWVCARGLDSQLARRKERRRGGRSARSGWGRARLPLRLLLQAATCGPARALRSYRKRGIGGGVGWQERRTFVQRTPQACWRRRGSGSIRVAQSIIRRLFGDCSRPISTLLLRCTLMILLYNNDCGVVVALSPSFPLDEHLFPARAKMRCPLH